ncbi:hypothetical protein GCM10027589_48220 [Actinocorallia lasiicapitis]
MTVYGPKRVTFSNGAKLKYSYEIKTYAGHKTLKVWGTLFQDDDTPASKIAAVAFKIPVFSGNPNRKFKAAEPARKTNFGPVRYKRGKRPSITLYLVRSGVWRHKDGPDFLIAPLHEPIRRLLELEGELVPYDTIPRDAVEYVETSDGGAYEVWEEVLTFDLDAEENESDESEEDDEG